MIFYIIGPVVTFNETEVYVQESETVKTHASFTLDRRGTDLNVITMVTSPPVLLLPNLIIISYRSNIT